MEHLAAPPVTPGKKDLVLLPSHLWLTIHESIGHSTELDRALGYEANYAGTSFLTTDKMGKFRVGSELVNFFGDRTNERGLSTVKYDDDGVKTTKFPIIEKGIFKHYQTIRDQAHLIGEKESRGCCYADSLVERAVPAHAQRVARAGPRGSDARRPDRGRRRRHPDRRRRQLFDRSAALQLPVRRRRVLGDQGRQEARDDFARRLPIEDHGFLARVRRDRRARRTGSSSAAFNDGKGEPGQINAVSHGCSPARFRQVNVLLTD